MIEEKWMLKRNKVNVNEVSEKYDISLLLAKIMTNRDIIKESEIISYINPKYDNLHSPTGLKDLKKGVDIIKNKIENNKRIRIIGDYDVDGVISTYILKKGLDACGANVDYEIPDRIKDGYGINENIIRLAYEDGIDTIITCDNGIAAIDQIKYAKELGMTVIVTDHHDVAFIEDEHGNREYMKPIADAIINPKQFDCEYDFDKICGAGVAFKLIEELHKQSNIDKEETYKLIEFVAIATVCDVVDLVNENRIFVKNGLENINNSNNIGLKELIKETGLEGKEISSYHLGFVIGPCINASGRLDSAKKGLELLLSTNEEEAKNIAREIVELNVERKDMTIKGVEKAIEIIEKYNMDKDDILVVYVDDIHESLAGIIAGRVKEKYNKPTIILTKSEDGAKGSARSIEEYNIFEGLISCKEYLSKFGGHPMAAGLSLSLDNIDKLRAKLNEESRLTKEDFTRKVMLDMQLKLSNINLDLVDEISKLEPFGKGNSKPLFGMKDAIVTKAMLLGKEKNVLKLKIAINEYNNIDAMIFKEGISEFDNKVIEKYGQDVLDRLYRNNYNNVSMDFSFYPSINEWNGNKTVQIIINNIR